MLLFFYSKPQVNIFFYLIKTLIVCSVNTKNIFLKTTLQYKGWERDSILLSGCEISSRTKNVCLL